MGIIAFREAEGGGREYLLIRRKDTLGFVDYLRGKYPQRNSVYLQNIVDEMTISEKRALRTLPFATLWQELWGEHIGIQYRGEEQHSRDKFARLRKGVAVGATTVSLDGLLNASSTSWEEPEWGFPKGRRNYQEKDLTAALREFCEETGYSSDVIRVVQNICPFEEIFTGSNYKSYRHRYYLAHISSDHPVPTGFQRTEVSKLKWMPLEDALAAIRPYNKERKDMLRSVDRLVGTHQIYSH